MPEALTMRIEARNGRVTFLLPDGQGGHVRSILSTEEAAEKARALLECQEEVAVLELPLAHQKDPVQVGLLREHARAFALQIQLVAALV